MTFNKSICFQLLIFLLICFSAAPIYGQLPSGIDIDSLKVLQDSFGGVDQLDADILRNATLNELNQNIDSNKPSTEAQGYQESKNNVQLGLKIDSLNAVNEERKPQLPSSDIYGQNFFRNGNINFYEKASEVKAPENYVLGRGDELNISIWGNSYYNNKFKVDQNGAIFPKLIGKVYLKDLTLAQARSLLISRFKKDIDLNNSNIEITLTYSRIITVNIVGEVFKPGSYKIPAVNTAFNSLMSVGGMTDIGTVRAIKISRSNGVIDELDVYEFLNNPDKSRDYFLRDNDFLHVGTAGKIVKVMGEVKRPMSYELLDNEHLQALIDFSGGLTAEAFTRTIQIKRILDNKNVLINIDLDSLKRNGKQFNLRNGDEIQIKRIPSMVDNVVQIDGEVPLPGVYALEKDKSAMSLKQLITMAGGLTQDAYLPKAYIFQIKDAPTDTYFSVALDTLNQMAALANVMVNRGDSVKILSNRSFQDDYTVSIEGAVRSPGILKYADGLTLSDALYLSGGLRQEAANNKLEVSRVMSSEVQSGTLTPIRTKILEVEVQENWFSDKVIQNFVLEPNDIIFVRNLPEFKVQEIVEIQGEVRYPGLYAIINGEEKVSDLLARAGGLRESAFMEGARLIRSWNDLGEVFLDLGDIVANSNTAGTNYLMKKGDVIIIPKINELVTISGALNFEFQEKSSLSVPYTQGKSGKYYIKNYAGGFKKRTDKKKLFVIEANGRVRRTKSILFFKIYPQTTIGSTVQVQLKPEKTKVPRRATERMSVGEVFAQVAAAVTTTLTIILLADRAL